MWRRTLFCLFAVVCVSWAEDAVPDSKVVHIAQGPVRGYKEPSGLYAFQGIPYASMPTGPNRYKAPLPPPIWRHVFEAVNDDIACPQAVIVTNAVAGIPDMKSQREDCLIANVYIPDTEEKNLPVMVYVHGGAFQRGYGNLLVPKKLVTDHNIILVTFNFRLGPHGFLCLGTEDVPGNAAMKDKVALLRWVKKNINSFGGNPDDVTIVGYSAGSAGVDLLMLSKSAAGLFHKVIAESGGGIASWALQPDPLQNAKEYAKYLNFTNVDDIHALENFYKTASYDLLTNNAFYNRTDSTFIFSPCVERATGEEAFMDESPVEILKSGNYNKVPVLYGYANFEGLLRIEYFDLWSTGMNKKFSDFIPGNLKFESEKQKEEVAKQIKEFYFGDKPVGKDNILRYVDFFTDVIFSYPILRAVKYHIEAGHDQVYLFEFSFVDEHTPPVPHTNVKGAKHLGPSFALADVKISEKSLKFSPVLRSIWANFIKTGKPVPEGSSLPTWPAVGQNWSPYMVLDDEISLKGSLLEQRTRFWEDIYSKHFSNPAPPPKPSPLRSEL